MSHKFSENPCFELSTIFLRNKNDSFLDRIVICDEKWQQPMTFRSVVDRDKALQHLPKRKPHQKEIKGDCFVVCSRSNNSFFKPGETITTEKYCQQMYEMN